MELSQTREEKQCTKRLEIGTNSMGMAFSSVEGLSILAERFACKRKCNENDRNYLYFSFILASYNDSVGHSVTKAMSVMTTIPHVYW